MLGAIPDVTTRWCYTATPLDPVGNTLFTTPKPVGNTGMPWSPRRLTPKGARKMEEHPDSLWQPYPDEVYRAHRGWPEGRSTTTQYRADRPAGKANRAMEILEERYARGEIDRRELEKRRAVLRDAAGT